MENNNSSDNTNTNNSFFAFTTEGRHESIIEKLRTITPETCKSAPGDTFNLLVKLHDRELTDVVPQLHSLKASFGTHLEYSQSTKRFATHSGNWFVMWRIEKFLELVDQGFTKEGAVARTLDLLPFSQCEGLKKLDQAMKPEKEETTKKESAKAARVAKLLEKTTNDEST